MAKRKPKEDPDLALIERVRKRLAQVQDAEDELRSQRTEDLKFMVGEQWPNEIKLARQADQRPCMTINRLPAIINLVTNDQRQNRPEVAVDPVSEGATQETAEVYQGLIRHIAYDSREDTALDTAHDYQVACGDGFFRVITEYESDDSFDQVIKVKSITNPDSVFLDPAGIEPDGSDCDWGMVVEDFTKEDFEQKWPNAQVSQGIGSITEYLMKAPDWFKGANIRVADYFEKEWKEKTLYLLANGETAFEDELPAKNPKFKLDKDGNPTKRSVQVPTIYWYKINGIEVLERTEWPGQWIPIIPVRGQECIVDGQRHRWGLIRFLRDIQRRYNYLRSQEAEIIALAPKAPYVVAEGQLDNYQADWESANTRNHAFLTYNPVSNEGSPLPAPPRQAFTAETGAVLQSVQQASDEFKEVSGIYQDELGSGGDQKSGKAIMARQTQSQSANFHLVDNLHKSLRHLGRILVDLIPKIYDTPRTVRILHENGESEMIGINQIFTKENGDKVHHKMDQGRYDVIVHSGPSYSSKRQESATWLQEVLRGNPQLMQLVGDIMFRNLDLPGATEVADRLKKMLPPQLQDNQGKPDPQQLQAQVAQSGQVIHHLMDVADALKQKIESKQTETDARIQMTAMQEETKRLIALLTIGSKSAALELQHTIGTLESQADRDHDVAMANLQASQAQQQQQGQNGTAPSAGGTMPAQPLDGSQGPNPGGMQ